MTNDEAELIRELAIGLDACADLVAKAVHAEERANEFEPLRRVTWRNRQRKFAAILDEAQAALAAHGRGMDFEWEPDGR